MDKGEFKIPRAGSAILIEHNGKYLLGKRNKKNYLNFWVIPGGKVEWGESLEQAGIREFKEETNLDIEIIKFLKWKEIINTKDDYHRYVFFFLGKLKNDDFDIKTNEDVSEAKFFSADELSKLEPLAESAKDIFRFLGILK
ncbi:MAG: NUDIX hydrolase [Nanoarchaeota archaeon]